MAPNAADARRRDLCDLLHLLAPFPGRLEHASRLALICALTTLVTAIYQTPEAALTAYIVFFINKPDRTTSLIMNVAVVILISLVIAFVFVLARAVVDDPQWRLGCMALISFVFLFMASSSKLQPVASILALMVAFALDMLGSAPGSELVTRGLLYAWLFAGIPAGVSIAVNFLLAPAPRRLAEQALAERLRLSASMLRHPNARTRRLFAEQMRAGSAEIKKALKLAGVERTSAAEDLAALAKATDSTIAILVIVDMIDRNPEAAFPDLVCEQSAATLDEMAAILDSGRYPVDVSLKLPEGSPGMSPLASAAFTRIRQVLAEFAEPPAVPLSHPVKEAGGFFLPDAFTNPDHARYALKTTAAAMFCYVLYSLLNWPGIHTSLITCYIVSLGTTAETVEKLTLRILGCLVGAAAGIAAIVFAVPDLTSIGSLMIVVFIGALAAGWIAVGSPRIAYAGFQIAFALFLCIIQGAKPGFDMVVARDRIIGILLGNLVVYLLFTNIWPVSVGARVDFSIAKLLRHMAAMAAAAGLSAGRQLAPDVCAALGNAERDLDLVRYEPSSIRPADDWLDVRSGALREIAGLIGPLLLNVEQDIAQRAAQRLESLASRLDDNAQAMTAADRVQQPFAADGQGSGFSEVAGLALRELIDKRLEGLEAAFSARCDQGEGAVSYAPA